MFPVIDLVQQGMSEKVALVVNLLSAFVTGFVLAYVRSWRLALALTSMLPCIAIAGGVMNKLVTGYMQYGFLLLIVTLKLRTLDCSRLSLKHVAEGGTIAEEVISTVRTAQAFGTQSILARLYNAQVAKAQVVEFKASAVQGGGLAVFFFVIYSSYALGKLQWPSAGVVNWPPCSF